MHEQLSWCWPNDGKDEKERRQVFTGGPYGDPEMKNRMMHL